MNYRLLVLFWVILLTGCKVDLYSNLSEVDANQMQAVLAYNKIHSSKNENKSNSFTLEVDENDFVKAVEILRQNGYPKKQYRSIDELFPTGQLITSPVQEQAKLRFLREQNLERMLSNVEGVISVNVMIVDVENDSRQRKLTEPSVSVLIKHSPEINLRAFNIKIKNLIKNALPGIKLENISLVSQMVNYQFDYSNSETFELDSAFSGQKLELIDEESKNINKAAPEAAATQLQHDETKKDNKNSDAKDELTVNKSEKPVATSELVTDHELIKPQSINSSSTMSNFNFDNIDFTNINIDDVTKKVINILSKIPTWAIWLSWFICILGIIFHAVKTKA
ncbi:type III secretion system inner membrane ring lipoprotein SctJ [Providencia sp. Me31A]|uniref:type III secretion system inner membrane ring lipoprotein SctJ n=1 Tax=Providencia sp. Me31A TaxID=3392637 RepID=UPI003D2BD57B